MLFKFNQKKSGLVNYSFIKQVLCKKPEFPEDNKEPSYCSYPLGIQTHVGERKDQEVVDITGQVLNLLIFPVSSLMSGKNRHLVDAY